MLSLETIGEHRSFAGIQGFYRHASKTIGLPMRFGVYQPPAASRGPVPVLFYLAGLTCTEETFFIKAGAQRLAAELGLMLVSCDTSPRDTGIAGEAADWEFGSGAGFYLNATQDPWAQHFRMFDYVCEELPEIILTHFPARSNQVGIFGHSMGGHGALVIALTHPERFHSVSAFAPICSASNAPWGLKAFPRYLGNDRAAWKRYDAAELLKSSARPMFGEILIDQGLDDKFLQQGQLLPESFDAACQVIGQPLRLRRHPGYDHGYYFVASFVDDHLRFHAEALRLAAPPT